MRGSLVVVNDLTQVGVSAGVLLLEILGYLERWRTPGDLRRRFALTEREVSSVVAGLLKNDFVETENDPFRTHENWDAWAPLASSFYFGTRDTRFPVDPVKAERAFQRRLANQPPLGSSRRQGAYFALPAPKTSPLAKTLLARRTWRRFGKAPVSIEQIGTLFGLCFGAHGWLKSPTGTAALKSSPSGGACQPIEAYLVSRSVSGILSGFYHYDSATHEFSRIPGTVTTRKMQQLMPSQRWFWRAPCWVILTARFDRTMRRYPSPRAFRNVFLEAGHFAQSFCLLATEQGLAPFCTHAVVDTAIEKSLGIDGVSEGVVYVLGCGSRPAMGWKPEVPGVGRAMWKNSGA